MSVRVPDSPSRVPSPRGHACFLLDSATPIDLAGGGDERELWRRLSYRVVRNPGDLLAHTRRALLCRREALQALLPAALQDLDHAAAGRCVALRRRLLAATRHRLEPAHAAWFDAALDGRAPAFAPPPCAGRVLPALTRSRRAADAAGDGPAPTAS